MTDLFRVSRAFFIESGVCYLPRETREQETNAYCFTKQSVDGERWQVGEISLTKLILPNSGGSAARTPINRRVCVNHKQNFNWRRSQTTRKVICEIC